MSRKSSLQAQTQSKSEVLQWVSFVLSLKVTKLEQVCGSRHQQFPACQAFLANQSRDGYGVQLQSGALYCQILDAYEGKVQLQKVLRNPIMCCFLQSSSLLPCNR